MPLTPELSAPTRHRLTVAEYHDMVQLDVFDLFDPANRWVIAYHEPDPAKPRYRKQQTHSAGQQARLTSQVLPALTLKLNDLL